MRGNEKTREICRLVKHATAASDVGDHELADSLLERCMALDDGTDTDLLGDVDLPPFRLRPYLILADDLLKRGDAAKALLLLCRARERWDNQPDLHLGVARCHQALEHWPEAEAAYRRCIELDPRAYVCILLASMLDQLGRDEEAVWWLHHSLVIDPNYEECKRCTNPLFQAA